MSEGDGDTCSAIDWDGKEARPDHAEQVPMVCIVLPTYGRPQLLLRALESVFRGQPAGVSISVIVVDNCSPESPVRQVHERFGSLVRVHVNDRNVGMPRNWAKCRDFAQATGARYWMLLEDDNLLEPNFLSVAVNTLESDPGADVFFTGCTYFDDQGRESTWQMWSVDGGMLRTGRLADRELLGWVFTCAMRVSSVLMRASASLHGFPTFNEDHYANHDVSAYGGLAIASRAIRYDQRPLMRYYVNPVSVTAEVAANAGLVFGELLRALRSNASALARSGKVTTEAWASAAFHAPIDRLIVAVLATQPLRSQILESPHRALTGVLVSRSGELSGVKALCSRYLGRIFWSLAGYAAWAWRGTRRRSAREYAAPPRSSESPS